DEDRGVAAAASEDEQVVLEFIDLNDLGAVSAPPLPAAAAGRLIRSRGDRAAAQKQDAQDCAPSARTFHDALLGNGASCARDGDSPSPCGPAIGAALPARDINASAIRLRSAIMPLDHYLTLGRSGLRVSPLCLGAMTFGEEWGWGASVADSEAM